MRGVLNNQLGNILGNIAKWTATFKINSISDISVGLFTYSMTYSGDIQDVSVYVVVDIESRPHIFSDVVGPCANIEEALDVIILLIRDL